MLRLAVASSCHAAVLALLASVTLWAADAGTPIVRNDRVTVREVAPGTAIRPSAPVSEVRSGLTRFNGRNRVHTETLTREEGRAVMVELK